MGNPSSKITKNASVETKEKTMSLTLIFGRKSLNFLNFMLERVKGIEPSS